MKSGIEKALKRFLKRKISITLSTVVAFLLSSNYIIADTLYIQGDIEKNSIKFSKDFNSWGENPFVGNFFENGIYTNNIKLQDEITALYNEGSGISFVNKNEIVGSGSSELISPINGIVNDNGSIKNLINEKLIKGENSWETANGIFNYYGNIESIQNSGEIIGTATGEGTGIANDRGSINIIENNGEIQGYSQWSNSFSITNIGGQIGKIINNKRLFAKGMGNNFGISNFYSSDGTLIGKINYIENNGEIIVESTTRGAGVYNEGEIGDIVNNSFIDVKVNGDYAFGFDNYGSINTIENNETLSVKGNTEGHGITNRAGASINNITNNGEIIVKEGDNNWGWGINNSGYIGKLSNNSLLEVTGQNNTTGIGNYDGIIDEIINSGSIEVKSPTGGAWGIENSGEIETDINNSGIIRAIGENTAVGIYNVGTIDNFINSGSIEVKSPTGGAWGIENSNYIGKLSNNSLLEVTGQNNTTGIGNYSGIINEIINSGIVITKSLAGDVWGISNSGEIETDIKNIGIIRAIGENTAVGIYNGGTINNFINSGSIEVKSLTDDVFGIDNSGEIKELKNIGIVKTVGKSSATGIGIYNQNPISLINTGVIFSNYNTIYNISNSILTNNGLLIGDSQNFINNNNINNGMMFKYDSTSGEYKIQGIGTDTDKIVNAKLKGEENSGDTQNWSATGSESILFANEKKSGMVYNGITDTLKISGSSSLSDSTVNSYTSAVVFDEKGGEVLFSNTVLNGGLDEKSPTILGKDGEDIVVLSNKSIVNGDSNLGKGDDIFNLSDTVQINGKLMGGEGIDTLTFTEEDGENSIKILHNIAEFEKTEVKSDVTLFDKTINSDGESENLVAQMGDIKIYNGSTLTLKVDGNQKEADKIVGHALYKNQGSLTTEKDGTLLLGFYGVGREGIIDLGTTDISTLTPNNVKTSSTLHTVEIKDNDIFVKALEDLKKLDIKNYSELNRIYHSLLESENLGNFTVTDERYDGFLKYLSDIYLGNPYAFSSELSRKSMSLLKNSILSKDLNPEVKRWAIYGGLTHLDGGREESFYGKGYYNYDIGSHNVEVDTRVTGAFAQGEYGVSDTVKAGIILGGNSSQSEIGSSKVEGDSIYIGAFAKKYVDNFRFTLGTGFHYGDYEANRKAIGYENITTTRSFSENYNDRGFNIYGDVKYSKEVGENLYLEPSFTLEYTYIDQDGADESGVLAMESDSKSFNYTTGEVAFNVKKVIYENRVKHILTAGVTYERFLNGYDEEYITGRFKGEKVGTDFDILVSEKEKDNFGLNLKYEMEKDSGLLLDIKGEYKFEHNNSDDEWTVGLGAGYRF